MEPLTTPRLVLDPWRERHAADLVRMSSDEKVMRHIGQGVWSPEYAAQRHAAALEHWARHGFGWRAILDRADRTFLGLAALSWLRDPIPGIGIPAVEIGWWTEPHAWGRGIATEAAEALVDDAFHRVRAELVVARCTPDNIASQRIIGKLAMTRHPYDAQSLYGDLVQVYTLANPSAGD
ncbi:GNAT family N-acetyltransferase [Actinomadura rudentiformis]|uniref:GNAT family N-acetyltransferase n=1 Tax=Actinomadura rudentiformis TaxID=359158 RepID=A0A6H9YCQ2_9ACTN|nr:GNAT family N-acetyltransferase [Actinomadura rudentiformis]KAB2341299.1 GNAT family N-acetyltransferase [Actinomadura rudentiformis]